MNYPLFLDIEASHPDDDAYPIAISWSLPDGTLKSVIVCPDDEWEPWDNSAPDLDIHHLMEQGESGPDIIREMNMDLSGQTVFVDGLDQDEVLVEKLFETFGDDPDFEIASLSQLFTNQPFESLMDALRSISENNQLDTSRSEDTVKAMLYLYQERGE